MAPVGRKAELVCQALKEQRVKTVTRLHGGPCNNKVVFERIM